MRHDVQEIVAYFKVLFKHFVVCTEEMHNETHSEQLACRINLKRATIK